MFKSFRIDPYLLALLILIALFVIVKIPYLTLPYYWDEAWVYGPALRIMEANGLSLLPDGLPPYYSRGHPLLFHFLGASWMSVFGTSLLSSHLFALLLSISLIVTAYLFCSTFHSKLTGILSAIVLVLQPIFLAQSVLVLPEIQLSLFSLLAVGFFIRGKWFWYIVFATAALFTKETGIVVVATTSLWFLISTFFLKRKEFRLQQFLLQSLYLLIPLILIASFFILQKKMSGWYFFPEHINYLKNDSRSFVNKFEAYSAYLFIYWGRNFLTALMGIALFLFMYLKKFKQNRINMPVMILGTYIIVFLVASSLNFYSDRYAMSMMVPFIMIAVMLALTTIKNRVLVYLVFSVYILIQLFLYIPKKSSSDHNLGYAESVKTSQAAVNYCIEHQYFNKKIFTHFLMIHNLTNPYCGYVNEYQVFKDASAVLSDATELCIISNMEGEGDYERIRSGGKFRLLKRFESDQAWTEIYEPVGNLYQGYK